MKKNRPSTQSLCSFVVITLQILFDEAIAEPLPHFTSHVSVRTPARSYSHGVGAPISSRITAYSPPYRRHPNHGNFRSLRLPSFSHRQSNGYPVLKPSVPFFSEDILNENSLNTSPWQPHGFIDFDTIPILPPSPYRVNSPNPESLWPEGLFIPPTVPLRPFGVNHVAGHRADHFSEVLSEDESQDPYLIEGSEAISAIKKTDKHGELFFNDIPHIESLLANQDLRAKNNLKPHRIASIRHNWPYRRT